MPKSILSPSNTSVRAHSWSPMRTDYEASMRGTSVGWCPRGFIWVQSCDREATSLDESAKVSQHLGEAGSNVRQRCDVVCPTIAAPCPRPYRNSEAARPHRTPATHAHVTLMMCPSRAPLCSGFLGATMLYRRGRSMSLCSGASMAAVFARLNKVRRRTYMRARGCSCQRRHC